MIVRMGQDIHDPDGPRATTRRALLSASAAAAAAVPLVAGSAAKAAPIGPTTDAPGQPARPQPPSAELRDLLRQLDRRRIESTVRRLAAFGTRHAVQPG